MNKYKKTQKIYVCENKMRMNGESYSKTILLHPNFSESSHQATFLKEMTK